MVSFYCFATGCGCGPGATLHRTRKRALSLLTWCYGLRCGATAPLGSSQARGRRLGATNHDPCCATLYSVTHGFFGLHQLNLTISSKRLVGEFRPKLKSCSSWRNSIDGRVFSPLRRVFGVKKLKKNFFFLFFSFYCFAMGCGCGPDISSHRARKRALSFGLTDATGCGAGWGPLSALASSRRRWGATTMILVVGR